MNIYTIASSHLAAFNSISFIVKAKAVTQVLELELNVALSKIRVNDAWGQKTIAAHVFSRLGSPVSVELGIDQGQDPEWHFYAELLSQQVQQDLHVQWLLDYKKG